MSLLGLLQYTTLVQGATNLLAQFIHIINNILKDYILEYYQTFIDNIPIIGPTSIYNKKEAASRIQQFMLKHIINLDQVLLDIKRARATIGPKSQFYIDEIKLVSYVYNTKERLLDSQKVIKILKQPSYIDITFV